MVALNVAINSHNNILVTLLVSNNFVELKGNVFKRCEVENLFQISAADIVERFTLSVYLFMVLIQFVCEHKAELTWGKATELSSSVGMIVAAEFVVDWVKHAFVIKFNRISPLIYDRFIAIFCADLHSSVRKCTNGEQSEPRAGGGMAHEHSTAVTARMGFVPIPLLCLVIRVFGHDVWPLLHLRHASGVLLVLLIWLCACALKFLSSLLLLGYACTRVEEMHRAGSDELGSAGRDGKALCEGVSRYTLFGKRIF